MRGFGWDVFRSALLSGKYSAKFDDVIIKDDLTVLDDASVGDDLTVSGEVKGSSAFLIFTNTTENQTGDQYLQCGVVGASTSRGFTAAARKWPT